MENEIARRERSRCGRKRKERKKKRKKDDDEKEVEEQEVKVEGSSLVKCTLQGLCITCRLQSFTLLFRLLA